MSDKRYTVYKHTSPDGKIYIGCTGDDPKIRWQKGYQHNDALCEDINRFGWDNFEHEIISSGIDEEDAYELEKELIHNYHSTTPEYGYNKSIGGKVNSGVIRSDEYRRKMSDSLRGEKHPLYGKHHTEDSKRKMSESTRGVNHPMYGKHHSEETKRKLSDSHRRKNLSEETLRKMREARLGKKTSDETIRKISKAHNIQVMCVETKIIYDSVTMAATDVGCFATNISAALNGRQNTAAGYHWSYVNKKGER